MRIRNRPARARTRVLTAQEVDALVEAYLDGNSTYALSRRYVVHNYQASGRSPEYHGFMVNQVLLTQAKQLSPADRLELIGELWQTLNPDDLQVTEAEKLLLDERLAEA